MKKPANDIVEGLPKPVGNPEIIKVLEQALEMARLGQVVGISIIMATGPETVQLASAGGFVPALVMGMEQLKRMLLDNVFAPKKSPIIRPGQMM